MTVYAMLADGFEEVEALAVVDVLKRAEIEVCMVSITEKRLVTGAHQIGVSADICFGEADFDKCDMIFLPGGMPGTLNLKNHKGLAGKIKNFDKSGKKLAAICAAPSILGEMGLLDGKRAVCFPGFEDSLKGAVITNERVVMDGNIFTSKGMGTALDLGLEIVKHVISAEKSEELARTIQYK